MSVPVDISKLSDVVKYEVFEKTVYDELVNEVNNMGTSGFVLKTKYDADKAELENKVPNVSNLVKKSDYNAKVSEWDKSKITRISGLVTTSELTAV